MNFLVYVNEIEDNMNLPDTPIYDNGVVYGPFSSKKKAEDWADKYLIEYTAIYPLALKKAVIPWEQTEPMYKCEDCGSLKYIKYSCRCGG